MFICEFNVTRICNELLEILYLTAHDLPSHAMSSSSLNADWKLIFSDGPNLIFCYHIGLLAQAERATKVCFDIMSL